ncbi:MAG TPA: hypothetical protein VMA31_00575 [Bryobacteraceae bacterium]|nr:hypothetical protein [Bryobacteraceae bacterium]
MDVIAPPEPESLEQTGLAESVVEHLILKILYFRGELYGQDLSNAIGLRFSVIQSIVELLTLRHHLQIKKSLGVGNVAAMFALTESGRSRARDYLESNQYCGPAPVPLDQYVNLVRQQRPREGWLTKEALAKTFKGMVLTENILRQLGPAISSSTSLLLHGKPGDGKSFLIESLCNLDAAPIFVPYAIECQGNIVQVYDPVYHQRVDSEQEPAALSISIERSSDRRWAKCKRPFIVTGGELTLDMLDLQYNQTSKVYEAPFQLKANNGIYLIDDFGRQRATPAEVLNRWIVPMERRVDYLTFLTGGKMTAPFETFLVFSTNLNPADLGDEAFLRRIQYKMLLKSPAENEFIRIFESFCTARRLPFSRDLLQRFIDKYYHRTGKPFRRCHPRDVLSHALNLIHFEKLPFALNDEILDRAFESCFVEESHSEATATPAVASQPAQQDNPIIPVMSQSCSDYWGDQVDQINTAFGTLTFVAAFRNRMTGIYHDLESARQYGEAETSRVLQKIHQRAFQAWLSLNFDQQKRDVARYVAAEGSTRLTGDYRELVSQLAPAGARIEDVQRLAQYLAAILDALLPKPEPFKAEPVTSIECIA